MKFTKLYALALLALGLTSCLDDKEIEDQKYGMINLDTKKIVELPTGKKTFSLPLEDAGKTINLVNVKLAANEPAQEDIVVTLSLANSQLLIDEYNEAEGAHLVQFPSNLYTLPDGLTVTIPKGSKTADLKLALNTINLDPAKAYALGLTITDVNKPGYTISGNFGTSLVKIGVKNKYDGNYTVAATKPMEDVTNSALVGYYPLDSDLVTTGPNSVVMYCYTYLEGYEGHPIKNGTASSYYGSFAPVFTMDANGNVVSVTNFYGQPAANGRSAKLDPSGVNKFTVNADGSKTLEVSYIMVQAGTDRTFFHEKWTFKKDRK